MVPSVTASAGRRRRATSRPFTNPSRAATSAMPRSASGSGTPAAEALARSTVHTASVEPSERSISPVRMTTVRPSAMMPVKTKLRDEKRSWPASR